MHAKRTAAHARLTTAERRVQAALRRRGLRWDGERDPTPILLPAGRLAHEQYRLLGHYSYRLFLRDVVKHRRDLRAAGLVRYVTPDVAARYLRFLVRARILRASGRGAHRLRDERIVSFGGTLEWYVAEILTREFGCDAAWGLRISHAAHGGDYDVVASADGKLIYAETKSAPPRQIVQEEVAAFVDRVDTLRPDVALFLADTTLRMRDKLVPLFAAERERRGAPGEPVRLEREIWCVGREVYLLNADPDLIRNVGTCLAAHFRGRGAGVG